MSFLAPIALAGMRAGVAAKIGSEGYKKAKNQSIELYGYDFVGLVMKLAIYFVVAYFIEKYIWWTQQKPINQILSGLFGGLGGLPLFVISNTFLKYFDNSEVNRGIKFWDIVKAGAVGLVAWEAYNYYKAQESLGGKISPMTIGVFGLILALLGFVAIPDIIKKIQEKQILNLGV